MKYGSKIILGFFIPMVFSCSSKASSDLGINKLTDTEKIYFASKRIHETFQDHTSGAIEYIERFLKGDSIKVMTEYAIQEKTETFYLKDSEKLRFFSNPSLFHKHLTRSKSEYYDVIGDCYAFSNEGINHNAIYIKKLCYTRKGADLLLKEIYLLDGD